MHRPSIAPLHLRKSAASRAPRGLEGTVLARSNPTPVRWSHIVGWLRRG
jgi:hypothetical protein